MKTNTKDRETLTTLLKGLDYLYSGIKRPCKTEEEYGIRLIKKWITENHEYFSELWEEVKR